MSGRDPRTAPGNDPTSGDGSGPRLRPRSWVVGILVSILVGGVEAIQTRLTSAVAGAYNGFLSSFATAGREVESAMAGAALSLLDVQATVNASITGVAANAGLGGPVVAVILFAVGIAVSFAALRVGLNAVKWIT